MSEKILVAVDGSECSREAFEHSIKDAKEMNSEITILKVVPTYGYSEENLDETIKAEIEDAEKLTEEWKKEAENEGLEAHSKVIKETNAATGIAKYAENENFDLIVIGSRGKTGLETVHLGSVSEGVVKRAKSPVLVVR